MNMRLVAPALAALAFCAPAVAQQAADQPTKGEERLAKMLEGRVAGEPEKCIRAFPVRDLTIIDGTALVYEVGTTLYVNYTRDPETLDDGDLLVVEKTGARFCDTDIVRTRDRAGQFYTGNIFLSDFIPYKKVAAGS